MDLRILGGGQDVGRSCFLLSVSNRHILLDCGAHHGFADARRFPDFSSLPADVLGSIDVILISHFHFDHAAAIPLLAQGHGCTAPIYMTEPTLELVRLMLDDFHTTSWKRGESLPFSKMDIDVTLSRVQLLKPNISTPVGATGDVIVTALHAGHSLGAVMFHVQVTNRTVLYSGDYSVRPDRILPSASVPLAIRPDVFITEATYCDGTHTQRSLREADAEMLDAIVFTLNCRGKVLIPVPAFGRIHSVCAALSSLKSFYPLDEVPMYVVSGLATKAAAVYDRFAADWTVRTDRLASCFQCETRTVSMSGTKRSRFANACKHDLVRNLRSFNRNDDWHVIDDPGPIILFATPASLSAGISRDVFNIWSTHPENLVVVPSAAFATSVAAGAFSTKFLELPNVRCKIVNMSVASHPDQTDILRMCRHVDPRCIVLVHAEKTKVLAFRESVEKLQNIPVFAPANNSTISIKDNIIAKSLSKCENEIMLPRHLRLFLSRNETKGKSPCISFNTKISSDSPYDTEIGNK